MKTQSEAKSDSDPILLKRKTPGDKCDSDPIRITMVEVFGRRLGSAPE